MCVCETKKNLVMLFKIIQLVVYFTFCLVKLLSILKKSLITLVESTYVIFNLCKVLNLAITKYVVNLTFVLFN